MNGPAARTTSGEIPRLTWLAPVRIATIVIVVWAVVLQVTVGVIIPPVLGASGDGLAWWRRLWASSR